MGKSEKESITEMRNLLGQKVDPNMVDWVIIYATDYQTSGGYQIIAIAQPYIKKEVAEKIADEVFGVDGWENDYEMLTSTGYIKYWIRFKNNQGEWVYKRSASSINQNTQGQFKEDAFEIAITFAEKRCWAKLGIGRYLKYLPQFKVQTSMQYQEGWNSYRFKSKVDKGQWVKFYWQEPQLPPQALPEGFEYDQLEDTTKAPPKREQKKAANKQQWKSILSYYNNLTPMEQEDWNPYLFVEEVDNESGEVNKLRPKKITSDYAKKILDGFEKGYGKLNSEGIPEKLAAESDQPEENLPPSNKGVSNQQVKDMFDAEEEPPKKK